MKEMKRFSKQIALCWVMALLLAGLTSVSAAKGEAVFRFTMSQNDRAPEKIIIRDNTLVLEGVPDLESYRYIWLCLTDSEGNELTNQIVERSHEGSATFSLGKLEEGTYQIVLFHGDQKFGKPYSSILTGLLFDWSTCGTTYHYSEYYTSNLAFTANQSTSLAAQAAYLLPSAGVQSNEPEITAIAEEITDGLTGSYEKALAVHDWVCDNLYYDVDILHDKELLAKNDALTALKNRRSACGGYAHLATALLRAAGIPAKYVIGATSGSINAKKSFLEPSGYHAWTEAYIDTQDRWLVMDTTADSSNLWENGAISRDSGCSSWSYFDPAPERFALSHVYLGPPAYHTIYIYNQYREIRVDDTWTELSPSGIVPVCQDNYMSLPLRALIEALGGKVNWQPGEGGKPGTILCQIHDYTVNISLNSVDFTVNGVPYTLEAAPTVTNGVTTVPINTLLIALGCKLEWADSVEGWELGRLKVTYYL